MTRQLDKIEQFKDNFSPLDSIHAKFGCKTGFPVVGDHEWGHLQVKQFDGKNQMIQFFFVKLQINFTEK